MKTTHRRDRYHRGSLTSEGRANGPAVWVYRWREPVRDGKTVQRKRIIGTKKEYATESAAWKAVDVLRLDINAEVVSTSPLRIRELAEHYKDKELGEGCGKTVKTRETYTQHIDDYIVPVGGRSASLMSRRSGSKNGSGRWIRPMARSPRRKPYLAACISTRCGFIGLNATPSGMSDRVPNLNVSSKS